MSTHTHTLTCVYMHTGIHAYIYIYIHTHIHTYIHTHMCTVCIHDISLVNLVKSARRSHGIRKLFGCGSSMQPTTKDTTQSDGAIFNACMV